MSSWALYPGERFFDRGFGLAGCWLGMSFEYICLILRLRFVKNWLTSWATNSTNYNNHFYVIGCFGLGV